MTFTLLCALILLGSCTGFLAGLLGIGGGMILTPFITLILSMDPTIPQTHIVHIAIATSMASILFTSLSSVRAHAQHNAVLWPVLSMLIPGIILGSMIGAQVAGSLSSFWVTLIFTLFVSYSAIKMFLPKKAASQRTLPGRAGLFGVGSGIGFISSIVGAGGGFIAVPFLSSCQVPLQKAIGTSAAIGFPIALFGTIGYIYSGWSQRALPAWPVMLGYIHLPALLCIAGMSIIMAPLGASIAHRIDTKPLKRIFACILLCLATYMAYRTVMAW